MSNNVSIDDVEAALKTLRVSKAVQEEALTVFSDDVLGGMPHNKAADRAIESTRPHLKKDADRRIKAAKQRAGLTFGSRVGSAVDEFTERASAGVRNTSNRVKAARNERAAKPAKTDTKKKDAAKKGPVYAHRSFHPAWFVVATIVPAAIGVFVWLFFGRDIQIKIDDTWGVPWGTVVSAATLIGLVAILVGFGVLILSTIRNNHEYSKALDRGDFPHWTHNTPRLAVFSALIGFVLMGILLWLGSILFGYGGWLHPGFGASNNTTFVFWVSLIIAVLVGYIAWRLFRRSQRNHGHYKYSADRPLSKEGKEILQTKEHPAPKKPRKSTPRSTGAATA